MAVDWSGRHAGIHRYIHGWTWNFENDRKTNNLWWMLYSVYAVLGENSLTWRGKCGDGFECGHHVVWIRVMRRGTACTLDFVYVSIRLRGSQWVQVNREIQHSGHNTTGCEPGHFADLTNLTQIAASLTISPRSKDRLDGCTGNKMAELTVILIRKFDGTNYKCRSLEIEMLSEENEVLGIVDGTEEAPDA